MIYPFHVTYNNMFHYTTESILPVLDYRPDMKEGDSVILPDFPSYPIKLVEGMIPRGVSVRVGPAFIPKKFMSCYLAASGMDRVQELCREMLTYVESVPVPQGKPIIYMSFRLHTRRWLPISNIQELVDRLKDKYTILLSLNPTCEKITDVPDIKDVVKIYDLTYAQQLMYAKASTYAIFSNGVGMIFPRIANLPGVMITPCLITETSVVGAYYGNNIVVVSDKRTDINASWNSDIEKVSVDSVLEAFNKAITLPRA